MKSCDELIEVMQVAGGCTVKQVIDLEESWHERNRKLRAIHLILSKDVPGGSRQLKLRFEILERDGFRCRYCGRSVAQGATLQIDHINPKSKGGQDIAENYLTACAECNVGKRDILLEPLRLWQLRQW